MLNLVLRAQYLELRRGIFVARFFRAQGSWFLERSDLSTEYLELGGGNDLATEIILRIL